jgi:hypothetical protein
VASPDLFRQSASLFEPCITSAPEALNRLLLSYLSDPSKYETVLSTQKRLGVDFSACTSVEEKMALFKSSCPSVSSSMSSELDSSMGRCRGISNFYLVLSLIGETLASGNYRARDVLLLVALLMRSEDFGTFFCPSTSPVSPG